MKKTLQPKTASASTSYVLKSGEDVNLLGTATTRMLKDLCAPINFENGETVNAKIHFQLEIVEKMESNVEEKSKIVHPSPHALYQNSDFWKDAIAVDRHVQFKRAENIVYICKQNILFKGIPPSKFYFAENNLARFIMQMETLISAITLCVGNGRNILSTGGIVMDEEDDNDHFWTNPTTIVIDMLHIRPYTTKHGLYWKLWQKLDRVLVVKGKEWEGSRNSLTHEQTVHLVCGLKAFLN